MQSTNKPQLVEHYNLTYDNFEGTIVNNVGRNIQLTLTYCSPIEQDKYFPLSATNGFRLILILNTTATAFQMDQGSTGNHTVIQPFTQT